MYKEANPAVFAIVTFPFLFGVMFGDVGHGSLLLIAGSLMVLLNEKLKNVAGGAISQLRYLIFMLGIFATYNGIIYNEFFAIPLEIFGNSCYKEGVEVLYTQPFYYQEETKDYKYWNPSDFGYSKHTKDCVYPVGMDPRWF